MSTANHLGFSVWTFFFPIEKKSFLHPHKRQLTKRGSWGLRHENSKLQANFRNLQLFRDLSPPVLYLPNHTTTGVRGLGQFGSVMGLSPFCFPTSLSITKLLSQVYFSERRKPLCVYGGGQWEGSSRDGGGEKKNHKEHRKDTGRERREERVREW